MFKNETKNAMMAFAVVAMFMLSAFAVVLTPSDADNTGETYVVKLRTDDSFQYTPGVNMNDNVSISASSLTGASFTNGKLSYSSSEVNGTTTPAREVVLTASWGQHSLTQTATQTIQFQVYDKLALSHVSKAVGVPTTQSSGILDTVSISNGTYPATPAWGTASWTGTNASTYFSVATSGTNNETLTVSVISAPAAGSYSVTVPATYSAVAITGTDETSAGLIEDTINYTLDITVDTALTVVEQTIYAYQGENSGSKTFTVQTANGNGNAATFSVDSTSSAFASIATNGTNNKNADLTINTNYGSFAIPSDSDSKTFTINVTANQAAYTTNNVEKAAQTDSGAISFVIYKALKFTTTPTQTATNSYASQISLLDVLFTTTVSGANKVVIEWGDGQKDQVDVKEDNTSIFKSHKYAQGGIYAIKSTAYNDFKNNEY